MYRVADMYCVEHPVYKNSYDKTAVYNSKLLDDMKKIQHPIERPRRMPRVRPNKVSRVRRLCACLVGLCMLALG